MYGLISEEAFNDMINQCDENGDGEIDYQEFMRCLSEETLHDSSAN